MKVYYEYANYSIYSAELEIDNDLKVTEEQIKDIINKEPHDRTLEEVDILNAIQDYMCDEVGFNVVDSYEFEESWKVEED